MLMARDFKVVDLFKVTNFVIGTLRARFAIKDSRSFVDRFVVCHFVVCHF
jgi:hypothetical protein